MQESLVEPVRRAFLRRKSDTVIGDSWFALTTFTGFSQRRQGAKIVFDTLGVFAASREEKKSIYIVVWVHHRDTEGYGERASVSSVPLW